MFKPVGTIIGGRRFGKSSDAVMALQVRRIAQGALAKECADLPDEILGQVHVKSYANGYLTIVCPPLVAAELYMRSEGLKKVMDRELGGNVIREIRFKVS